MPLELNSEGVSYIKQRLLLVNRSAEPTKVKYSSRRKSFRVSRGEIVLMKGLVEYVLVEFHFHKVGEHRIDGDVYPAEVHYVYQKKGTLPVDDPCGSSGKKNNDTIIVCFGLDPAEQSTSLNTFDINLPEDYYQYSDDDALWIVSRKSLKVFLPDCAQVAQPSRWFRKKTSETVYRS